MRKAELLKTGKNRQTNRPTDKRREDKPTNSKKTLLSSQNKTCTLPNETVLRTSVLQTLNSNFTHTTGKLGGHMFHLKRLKRPARDPSQSRSSNPTLPSHHHENTNAESDRATLSFWHGVLEYVTSRMLCDAVKSNVTSRMLCDAVKSNIQVSKRYSRNLASKGSGGWVQKRKLCELL